MENSGDVQSGDVNEGGSTAVADAPNDIAATGGDSEAAGQGENNQDIPSSGKDGEEPEFVTDENGNKFVPFEAFKARIDKLTAQKSAARNEVLEGLKSDPDFRNQMLAELKGAPNGEVSASNNASGEADESVDTHELDEWLGGLPPEHQSHYTGMLKAYTPALMRHLDRAIAKATEPLMRAYGEQKVNEFKAKNKDFPQYQRDMEKIMGSGRARSIEDAYILASHESRLKAANAAGARGEAGRQEKLRSIPSNKGSGGISVKGKPATLAEALKRAAEETGYIQ